MRTEEGRQLPAPLEDRAHRIVGSGLASTPVDRQTQRVARAGRHGPLHAPVASSMPQPHYRGAPALTSDTHAAGLLAASGARLIPLKDRGFNTAPGGVLVLAGVLDDVAIQELADLTMMAGSILARIASIEWWRDQGD